MSAATMFFVTRWPNTDLLLDALKYGSDPLRKFRIELTVRHHSLDRSEIIEDMQVTGFRYVVPGRTSSDIELELIFHKELHYCGHL